MAKINLGGLAQDVRGSLNGTVFSRNRGGAYTRTKVSPVQPLTNRQTVQRAIFSVTTKSWQVNTAAQQVAWNAWAAINRVTDVFGNSLLLSGIAAFTKINGTLLTFGLPAILNPPPPPGAPGAAAVSVTGVAATNTLTVTWAAPLAGGEMYQVWCTQGVSAGATPQKNMFRLAANVTGIAAAATTAVIPTALNPLIVFIAGNKVGVLVVRLDANGVIIDSTRFDFIAT